MRPLDRLLRREPTPPSPYAVRPFGTTAAEAAAADSAAAASGTGSAGGNLTTGGTRPPSTIGTVTNRGTSA